MNRCLALFLALCVVLPFFAASALAAEEYVIDLNSADSIMTLPTLEGDGNQFFVLDYAIPEGVYQGFFSVSFDGEFFSSDPFSFEVIYEPVPDWVDTYLCEVVVSVSTDGHVEQFLFRFITDNQDVTYFSMYAVDSDGNLFDFALEPGMCITLIPLSQGLSDVVTVDMISGVLSGVVSVFPVALVVFVGFVALRKGIAFVRKFLADS